MIQSYSTAPSRNTALAAAAPVARPIIASAMAGPMKTKQARKGKRAALKPTFRRN